MLCLKEKKFQKRHTVEYITGAPQYKKSWWDKPIFRKRNRQTQNIVLYCFCLFFIWTSLPPWLELRIGLLMYLPKIDRTSPHVPIYTFRRPCIVLDSYFFNRSFCVTASPKKSLFGWYCWSTWSQYFLPSFEFKNEKTWSSKILYYWALLFLIWN